MLASVFSAAVSFQGRPAFGLSAPSLQPHPRMAVTSWYDSGLRLDGAVVPTKAQTASNEEWPMLGGVNKWHARSGPWPKEAAREMLDEADWPKRPPPPPPPPVDFLGRPLELTLTEEQLAAFGGSPTRALTYPSLEEEAASLKTKASEREAAIGVAAAEISRLEAQIGKAKSELATISDALKKVAAEQAKAAPAAPVVETAAKKAPAAKSSAPSEPPNPAAIGGVVALAAAAAAYYYTSGGAAVVESVSSSS